MTKAILLLSVFPFSILNQNGEVSFSDFLSRFDRKVSCDRQNPVSLGTSLIFEGSARLSVTLRKRDATCSFSGGQLDSDNNFDNFEN